MSETKTFPTVDVLTTITGRMLRKGGLDGVCAVLNWMTGESVFTHQLPRISREARALLVANWSEIAEAVRDSERIDASNYREYRATWEARLGPTIDVPRFTAETHEFIDPISEAAEYFPPERMVVVRKGEAQR